MATVDSRNPKTVRGTTFESSGFPGRRSGALKLATKNAPKSLAALASHGIHQTKESPARPSRGPGPNSVAKIMFAALT